MFEKGRGRKAQGEQHGMAKLSNEQADQLVRLYSSGECTQRQLAELYGVHVQTVFRIIHGLRRAKVSGSHVD
jgi:DNA-binding MarR family transcriptional regulator